MSDYKVAILWRGDRATRTAATPQNNRYRRIFEELGACGILPNLPSMPTS